MCALGARRGEIKASIGPAMQVKHYEVQDDYGTNRVRKQKGGCFDLF